MQPGESRTCPSSRSIRKRLTNNTANPRILKPRPALSPLRWKLCVQCTIDLPCRTFPSGGVIKVAPDEHNCKTPRPETQTRSLTAAVEAVRAVYHHILVPVVVEEAPYFKHCVVDVLSTGGLPSAPAADLEVSASMIDPCTGQWQTANTA